MTIKHLLTVSRHAECQALLEAAGLASVPIHTVHHTVLLPGTLVVDHARTLRPPKEAFAAFARDHAIVDATRLVAAHFARNDLDLGWKQKRRTMIFKHEQALHMGVAIQKRRRALVLKEKHVRTARAQSRQSMDKATLWACYAYARMTKMMLAC